MKRKTRIEDNEINFESILFLLTDSCLGNRRQHEWIWQAWLVRVIFVFMQQAIQATHVESPVDDVSREIMPKLHKI